MKYSVQCIELQLISPTLRALKCEHYGYTNSCMFRHFNRCKDFLMMALTKCRNMSEILFYLLRLHFSACKVGLVNCIFASCTIRAILKLRWTFLGAFAKWRKATVTIVMSVCQSVRL
jgi:hypothetical protein